WERELIPMQRRNLGAHQVRIGTHVVEPRAGCDRKLTGIAQTRVRESAFAVHFDSRHKSIPIWNGAQPVQVCRLTPARPNAGGISVAAVFPSGRKPLPSRNNSASNFPGPQAANTLRTAPWSTPRRPATALRSGARLTIAPTFRSRLAQPSNRD